MTFDAYVALPPALARLMRLKAKSGSWRRKLIPVPRISRHYVTSLWNFSLVQSSLFILTNGYYYQALLSHRLRLTSRSDLGCGLTTRFVYSFVLCAHADGPPQKLSAPRTRIRHTTNIRIIGAVERQYTRPIGVYLPRLSSYQ